MSAPTRLRYVTVGPEGAERVHRLYLSAPAYFETLSIPIPSVGEVATDLTTAATTARRWTELVQRATATSPVVPPPRRDDDGTRGWSDVAYLDVTLDNLAPGDATINLLLVRSDAQRQGIGRAVVADLERRLAGRYRRVLASVYGKDGASRAFWTSMGFHRAIDAGPVLEWYAKRLTGSGDAEGGADPVVAASEGAG